MTRKLELKLSDFVYDNYGITIDEFNRMTFSQRHEILSKFNLAIESERFENLKQSKMFHVKHSEGQSKMFHVKHSEGEEIDIGYQE